MTSVWLLVLSAFSVVKSMKIRTLTSCRFVWKCMHVPLELKHIITHTFGFACGQMHVNSFSDVGPVLV
jgi:hypothetical protein